MFYKPIFSNEAKDNENNNVSIIGKIIEIKYERKYTKIKILDSNGYINCVTFEPFTFEEFRTILILGNIRKFRDEYNLYIKKFVYLDENDEIYWRSKFLSLKNQLNNKNIDNNKKESYNENKKSYNKIKSKNNKINYNKIKSKDSNNYIKNNDDHNNDSYYEDNNNGQYYNNKKEEENYINKNNIDLNSNFEENEYIKDIKKILEIIKSFDEGEGVPLDVIKDYTGFNDEKINEILQKLLAEGEIYEYLPGRYKLL